MSASLYISIRCQCHRVTPMGVVYHASSTGSIFLLANLLLTEKAKTYVRHTRVFARVNFFNFIAIPCKFVFLQSGFLGRIQSDAALSRGIARVTRSSQTIREKVGE